MVVIGDHAMKQLVHRHFVEDTGQRPDDTVDIALRFAFGEAHKQIAFQHEAARLVALPIENRNAAVGRGADLFRPFAKIIRLAQTEHDRARRHDIRSLDRVELDKIFHKPHFDLIDLAGSLPQTCDSQQFITVLRRIRGLAGRYQSRDLP